MSKITTSVRIDEELWRRLKIKAIEREMTTAELLEELIRKEVEE